MNRTALLAAVGVAVLGFVLLGLYIRRFQIEATGGAPVQLLMVAQDVDIGEPLTKEMLATRALPQAYVEDRHILAANISQVVGVRVGVALRANQTLLSTDLSSTERQSVSLAERVPKGKRAITIATRLTSSHSGLLRPGNSVDVLMTSHKGQGGDRVTLPLLQNLLVLAVGSNVKSAFDEGGEFRDGNNQLSVTLLVSLDQAALLAHADGKGALRLIVRNDDDLDILEELPETLDSDIMEANRRAMRQRGSRLEQVR